MKTDNAPKKLRVDFGLIPMTAIFAATLTVGLSTHDIYGEMLGLFGLLCVAGICAAASFT